MAKESLNLVLNDLDEIALKDSLKTVSAIRNCVTGVPGSVVDQITANQLIEHAVSNFGNIDVLVTCAGYNWDVMLHNMTDQQWESVLDVHLTGTMRIVRAAFKVMRETAKLEISKGEHPSPRKIITISSLSSFGNVGQSNYSAAKAGVIGFTRTVALEGAPFNILANSVAFGPIDTRLTRPREDQQERIGAASLGIPVAVREEYLSRVPLGRPGTIEEAVGPLMFLISDQANYISAATIEVNGAAHPS